MSGRQTPRIHQTGISANNEAMMAAFYLNGSKDKASPLTTVKRGALL